MDAASSDRSFCPPKKNSIETFRFPAICQIADNLARENADNLNVKNLGRFEIVENSAILSNLFEIVSNLNCWQFGKLLKI